MTPGPLRTQRLFFALWPDETVRAQIGTAAQAVIAREGLEAAVAPDRYHLTLLFLGDVDPAVTSAAAAAAGAVRAAPFDLSLDRTGYFYGAKVLWIGAERRPEALTGLWLQLRAAIEAAGLPHERRALAIHVTCARRLRRPVKPEAIAPIPWRVREFVLVHSVLGDRPEYRIAGRWPLGLTP